jgi:hypothetical protein
MEWSDRNGRKTSMYCRYQTEGVAWNENYVVFGPIVKQKHQIFDVDVQARNMDVLFFGNQELEKYFWKWHKLMTIALEYFFKVVFDRLI